MALTFRLKPLNAPPGAQCLTTLNAVLAAVAKYVEVVGPDGIAGMIISAAEPSVDDRDKVWLRLEDNGQPLGLFQFADDEWVQIPGLHQGAIILYSGETANIPSGWVLADGTNGAPDLTDNTAFASLWEPNYSAPTTTYTLCPIYFKGFASA